MEAHHWRYIVRARVSQWAQLAVVFAMLVWWCANQLRATVPMLGMQGAVLMLVAVCFVAA